jgi:hypothetical protein
MMQTAGVDIAPSVIVDLSPQKSGPVPALSLIISAPSTKSAALVAEGKVKLGMITSSPDPSKDL